MAEERIKRVPVIADGGLVGMVVENPEGVSCRVRRVELDGSELPSAEISMLGDGRQWFCCSEVGGQRGRVDH